jgi:hypothetical protein
MDDRDVGTIRTNNRRAFVCAMYSVPCQRRLFPGETFRFGFGSGVLVGTIVYRLRYGVLRPARGEGSDPE